MNARGRRKTAADAWLADPPATLTRRTNTRVRSIALREERAAGIVAAGIVVDSPAGLETIRARRDVILCSGAAETAALLMRSGIGPAEVLREAGVDAESMHLEWGRGWRIT